MLATTPPCAFIATTDAAKAKHFFTEVLGLKMTFDDGFALVFDLAGVMLRVQRVKDLTPHPFTTLGWNVTDIEREVDELEKRGVVFERYGFLEQDARGIWTAPGGAARVAWFKDPDGNTLSLAQH